MPKKSKKSNDSQVFSRGCEVGCHPRKALGWRVFWGMFFVVAATAVTLSAFDIFNFAGLNIGWIILIIFLIALSVASLFKLNWFGLFMSAAGIVTILNYHTDYLDLTGQNIGIVWTVAVLLTIGFSILFHHGHYYYYKKFHGSDWGPANPDDNDEAPEGRTHDKHARVENHADGQKIYASASFGETVKYVNTDNFEYALFQCNLGAVKAYFNEAKIVGDSATIEVNGSLCGFELYVPKEWNVIDNINHTLSGVEEKNPSRINSDVVKTVYLTGNLNLAGIEIIYI